MKDTIFFVHGNGFPSPCYRQLLSSFEPRFDCHYIDRVGHSPDFPVTDNWDYLVSEVISSIQAQASKPVIAVGHSLGGVLSVLAAIAQPALFKAVILLDSPLLGRMQSTLIRISKALGFIDRVTPAFQTRQRCRHWKKREQVIHYLRRRALFKSFSEACLQDYIDYGMAHDERGYSLRFDPEIEYQIYRTIPDACYENEGKLQTPTTLIYGDRSHLIKRKEVHYMEKKYGIRCVKTTGSHMFPMEHPDVCAKMVVDVIDKFVTPHHVISSLRGISVR